MVVELVVVGATLVLVATEAGWLGAPLFGTVAAAREPQAARSIPAASPAVIVAAIRQRGRTFAVFTAKTSAPRTLDSTAKPASSARRR